MSHGLFKLTVPLVLGIWALPSLGDDADLQRQLEAQQKNILRMQNDLLALQAEIAQLRGDLDALKHTQHGQPPQAPAATAAAAAASAAASVTAPAAGTVQSSEAKQAYDEAYALILRNDLPGSVNAFQGFIAKYPQHELVTNAWYWQGQAQYKLKQYQDARVSFLNAASDKNSGKRPDALYKLGLITRLLGDEEKAKRYFEVVVSEYPEDAAAALATSQLNPQ
ncbi:MAG: tol-pal system protein YbgF [Succinivibrio sp.]|nr:tol-pal system protein YbgF [Succinivibrio sp.]